MVVNRCLLHQLLIANGRGWLKPRPGYRYTYTNMSVMSLLRDGIFFSIGITLLLTATKYKYLEWCPIYHPHPSIPSPPLPPLTFLPPYADPRDPLSLCLGLCDAIHHGCNVEVKVQSVALLTAFIFSHAMIQHRSNLDDHSSTYLNMTDIINKEELAQLCSQWFTVLVAFFKKKRGEKK